MVHSSAPQRAEISHVHVLGDHAYLVLAHGLGTDCAPTRANVTQQIGVAEVLETCQLERQILVDLCVLYFLFFDRHRLAVVSALDHHAIIPLGNERVLRQFHGIDEEVV